MAAYLLLNVARFASACSTVGIIYFFQIICHFFALFPGNKDHAKAHQMDDAGLSLHVWEGRSLNAFRKSLQVFNAGNQDILHSPFLKLGQDSEPRFTSNGQVSSLKSPLTFFW